MNESQTPVKIGLLPFYLKLYDDLRPEARTGFHQFIQDIEAAFNRLEITVNTAPICRIESEFANAIKHFEENNVDCIFTLHLAYSPSLEAIEPFCQTTLPVVILDTTMDADFSMRTSPERIMFNHGIHGVMDFASIMKRRQRHFEIAAGHPGDGRLLERAADLARAARAARSLTGSRLLRIGDAFQGMGDFSVENEVLNRKFGFQIDQEPLEKLDQSVEKIKDTEIDIEIAADQTRYHCDLPLETHARSVRIGLGLRHLLEQGGYQGVSINFQEFNRKDRPADTMPFLEIAKSMARGVGYAGEGDVLTAAMGGALERAFGLTTFTEIFCADWNGNNLFLSHMGEINPAVAAGKPTIIEKPLLGGQSYDPAVLTCAVKPGPAVFVNLAPGPDQKFSLIVAPIRILAENEQLNPAMKKVIRTWIRPPTMVADFLEKYSRAGGTHHSVLVLGEKTEAIAACGRMMGVETIQIS